ncbi:MAG: ribbon-helix-helix domain-containing protein [Alphaproteobacteria bacterium]
MRNIDANTDPADDPCVGRSIRLHAMLPSIRLERRFWAILERMARAEGMSVPQFGAVLRDEVLERRGEIADAAS